MVDVVQWHSRRVAACVLVLLYVNGQRRNRKRWNIIKFGQNRILVEIWPVYNTLVQELLLLIFFSICVVIPCRRNVLRIWKILNFIDELKSYTFVFTSVRHFVECHANHVNRARVLIDWQSPTHTQNQWKIQNPRNWIPSKNFPPQGKLWTSLIFLQFECVRIPISTITHLWIA